MKPSFALNLTDVGITLLHRTKRGWLDVGSVAFSDPDLGAALDYLRSSALAFSSKAITTKVIIPESQILYLKVDAPGPDDASRRAQIESALDGRTPYSLDELAYDWSASGSDVTVAVVARETLDEAESFAIEHRFNPVSFAARPVAGFDKEPFFGASGIAQTLLKAGEQVEPDVAPIAIIPRDAPRADPASPQPATDDAQTAEAAVVAERQPQEPGQPEPDQPKPEPEPPSAPQLPAPDLPPHDFPEPAPPQPAPEPVTVPPVEPMPEPGPMDLPSPVPDLPAHDPLPPPMTMAPAALSSGDEVEAEAPMAVDVPQNDAPDDLPPESLSREPRSASVLSTQSPPEDELPPLPSSAAMMAFASRRSDEGAPRPLGAAGSPVSTTGSPSAAPELGAARTASSPTGRPAGKKPIVERPAGARPPPKFSYDDPVPPPQRMPGDPPLAPASVIGKTSKGLRSLGTMVTAPSIPGSRPKKAIVPPTPAGAAMAAKGSPPESTLTAPVDLSPAVANMKAAAQSLARTKPPAPDAIARGLSARTMPQRGKPRYLGLILTGVLLLILAIIAAWSSFYLTRADDPVAEVQTAEVAAGLDDEAIADGQIPGPDDEMLADAQDPAGVSDEIDLTTPVADAEIEQPVAITPELEVAAAPEPVFVPEETVAAEPPPPEVAAPAPQTGVQDVAAAAAQPNPPTQDEIFLAGMDAPPVLSDPLVLPQPATSGDAPPAAQMPPPPFGTVYQFDENGRIKPTAEGIVTPEGVTLVSGKPPVVPPKRSATVVAAAATPVTPAPAADAAPVADLAAEGPLRPADTFAADPALSAARPRVRPAGLAPEAAANDDDASLAPAEDSRFASLRPRLRPQAILAAGEAARKASESASLAAQAAIESAVASAADANLSPLAVSVSRVPAPRPRDLSRAVEAAVAAATRQPEARRTVEPDPAPAAEPKAKATAKAEEEADDEPEVVAKSAAPRIPTKANVAKQATFVNAINLSKINLIGVYGTQSKRYALVRQANGRYRKVQVGDNIDGGRVQAITASEVRYQKSGRMLTLAMPKG
ncbi:MAG: translation initiation factor 2 [Paracoccaceae bacterium]